MQVMIAHVNDEVTAPSRWRPDIPADLEQVVLRCLAKSPEDRYPDAVALEAALGQCELANAWDRARAAQWWEEEANLIAITCRA
jgi:serine/threonine-protein kinase